MYFLFVIKIRHKYISRDNGEITQKELSKLFFAWVSQQSPKSREDIDHWYWGFNQEKSDGFWLLWGIFNVYIKQNIITAELKKKQIFIQLMFTDWWKINHVKEGQEEKMI